MLDMYVSNVLSLKRFHGAETGNTHECLLKLSIGRVRHVRVYGFIFPLYELYLSAKYASLPIEISGSSQEAQLEVYTLPSLLDAIQQR
jgi:hypothetical protein